MAAASMSLRCVNLNKSLSGVQLLNPSVTIKWQAPHSSFVKIHFDGLVMGDSAASSFIHVGRTSVPNAEALALRDNLVKEKEKDFTRVEVEGDSKLVIEALNGRFDPPWRLIKLV
ncbi:hypothetical protein ACLB2K_029652 [Fragaria x ananassa]